MTQLTRFDRWEPFDEFMTLRNRMNRLWNRFGEDTDEPMLTAKWSPTADIYETKDAFIVKAEIPGIDEKDIDVEIENGVLTIQGERNFEQKTDNKDFHRIERSYGKFMRAFTMPQNINADRIMAVYNNGVLEVTVPKKEEAKPKKIQLEVKKKPAVAA